MPNPAVLPCDSDVLIEFFLADELRPLQDLKSGFGIQPLITVEVDLELRWSKKFRDRFVHQLDKALKHSVLLKLDKGLFQSFLGQAAAGTSWSSYHALGAQYYGYVDRGEAYTYAAALSLGTPAASNDFRAIQTLRAQMMNIPAPILRSFDILVLAHDFGTLNLKECESVRSKLLSEGQGLPSAFRHKSFEDGEKHFSCRLQIGSSVAATPTAANYDDPLVLIPR